MIIILLLVIIMMMMAITPLTVLEAACFCFIGIVILVMTNDDGDHNVVGDTDNHNDDGNHPIDSVGGRLLVLHLLATTSFKVPLVNYDPPQDDCVPGQYVVMVKMVIHIVDDQ